MAQNKFGTFAGVFTPSILTILGVIMYLRLGWVVGNAGLVGSIIIILIAHVISISTGLSISSIATDKKVRAGGIYYILSRSLGLPIGGAIGSALFVGMGFSVSLYVIGFCESFNPIIGQGTGIEDMRLMGSIVLFCVALIAYISTTFALKIQFFVFIAIGLSLLSVLLGTSEFAPASITMFAPEGSVSMEVIFAVFFPAVTGFTAGVAMSGDLKNPKKAIPIGTMAAIGLGLVIYIGMAIFLSVYVGSDALKNDTNILTKIAFFSPLVIAGIWGATISSALGSILGAPRLLQALSIDRIIPKFIGKGSGKDNEPRVALILTFMLAEVGILIGDLDVIAGLVSMFFLTAYGFINLACALESWASSDFRPTFKIPKTISVIGFVATFAVMFKLDMVSMVGSFVVMGGIFLLLARREIKISSGNVWDGVWTSVVLKGLNRLSHSSAQERNWRPNILLFSGGSKKRPYMVEFAESMIGKLGTLTNFDLIENKSSKKLFSAPEQIPAGKQKKSASIFTRQHECADVYKGIETITKVYGFSGMEPNTVLMGWGSNTKSAEKLSILIDEISESGMNLLMLNYDSTVGYGDYSHIDIWLDKSDNYGSMAMAMIKFLLNSEAWSEAKVRFLAVESDSAKADILFKDLYRILDENRISAEVKVVNNSVEQEQLNEIIARDSADADLILLGLPSSGALKNDLYIDRINEMCENLGTVLLVKASSYFDPLPISFSAKSKSSKSNVAELQVDADIIEAELPDLEMSDNKATNNALSTFNNKLEIITNSAFNDKIINIFKARRGLIEDIKSLSLKYLNDIGRYADKGSGQQKLKAVRKAKSDLLFHIDKLVSEYITSSQPYQKEILDDTAEFFNKELLNPVKEAPEFISVYYKQSNFKKNKADNSCLKKLKFRKRMSYLFSGKDVKLNIEFRLLSEFFASKIGNSLYTDFLRQFGIDNYRDSFAIQKIINYVYDSLLILENSINKDEFSAELVSTQKDNTTRATEELINTMMNDFNVYYKTFRTKLRAEMSEMSSAVDRIDAKQLIRKKYKLKTIKKVELEKIRNYPDLWLRNITLISDTVKIGISIKIFSSRLDLIVKRMLDEILQNIDISISHRLKALVEDLNSADAESDDSRKSMTRAVSLRHNYDYQAIMRTYLKDIRSAVLSVPESIDIIADDSLGSVENDPFAEMLPLSVSLQRLVKYYIDAELLGPLSDYIEEMSRALSKSENVLLSQYRLINFHKLQRENASEIDAELYNSQYVSIIKSSQSILTEEIQIVKDNQEKFELFIRSQTKQAEEKLNPYLIIRSAGEIKQYVREQGTKQAISKLGALKNNIVKKTVDLFVKLWYRKSEALIYTKKIQDADKNKSNINLIYNFADRLTPESKMKSQLPFYYRQLFTGKQIIDDVFWVGRQNELKISYNAYEMFLSGRGGGLIISGASKSGKSALSTYLAGKFSKGKQVYDISPPEEGSVKNEVLKREFQKELSSHDDYDTMFANVPKNSVFVLNDIELWWERSKDGFEVIDTITEIVNKYGRWCFFILNVNMYSYEIITRIKNIDNNFLNILRLEPMNAKELRDLILVRHRSGNLRYLYNSKPEDNITDWQIAKLFNKYFEHTKGNPGVAIHSWVNNITKVKEGSLFSIREPERINYDLFEHIDSSWVIILIQFILHKRLNDEKIERIFADDFNSEIKQNIEKLLKGKILLKDQNGTMKISSYLQAHIEYKLNLMGVI